MSQPPLPKRHFTPNTKMAPRDGAQWSRLRAGLLPLFKEHIKDRGVSLDELWQAIVSGGSAYSASGTTYNDVLETCYWHKCVVEGVKNRLIHTPNGTEVIRPPGRGW